MEINGRTLRSWISSELANVSDERVTSHIRRLLVEPYVVFRPWDYGEPDQRYACWTVLDNSPSSTTGIAYCASGFGPARPWGLVEVGDDSSGRMKSMGMDSGWFTTFMGAFFDSLASIELPIWRVFKQSPDGVRIPLTEEGGWSATWRQRDDIQANDPAVRYTCDHSISVRGYER